MTTIKSRTELFFEQLGYKVYRNRIKSLLTVSIFVGFLFYQIPNISIDTSSEALLHKNDPSLQAYDLFKNQFGRSELIIITVKPVVFNTAFLNKLRAFHKDLENEVPYIKKVTSLVNARKTSGEEDVLLVEELLEGWPEKNKNLSELKDFVLKNQYYQNHIISADGRTAALVIETEASIPSENSDQDPLSGFDEESSGTGDQAESAHNFSAKENHEVVKEICRIIKNHHTPDFNLAPSGGPVVVDAFNRATLNDIRFCTILTLIIIAVFLAMLFQRASGVLLPLIVINSSLASTMGLMALFNVSIKITTTVIPGFLLAVSVADSVHILAIFYRFIGQGMTKEDAVAGALGHAGPAIVMTSLTTAVGLLSFSIADLTAISEIGFFSAAGVALALIYTIIMLPAVIAFVPIKKIQSVNSINRRALMDRVLIFVADFSTGHPFKILTISLLMFLVSGVFVFQLRFSHNIIEYFPDSSKIKKDLVFIDKNLKGAMTLEIVVDTKKENGIYDPDILDRIELLSKNMLEIHTKDIFVGKVFSINDIIKEINQALHENNSLYYNVPRDRKKIAQELFLFENTGSEDLEKIVDSQFSKTRMTIKTPWVDATIYTGFIRKLKHRFDRVFKDRAEIEITGAMALMSRAILAATYSMAKSYIIAFLAITLMMILFMKDIKIGLLSMIPNLLPIFIIMGIMGLFNVPLTMNTLLIGSIALGLVVDDTVHFMYNFFKFYTITQSTRRAVQETLLGTGRALVITSFVLAVGFFVLIFASLNHLVRFGFFTGMAILIALLADFLVAPALMVWVTGNKNSKT